MRERIDSGDGKESQWPELTVDVVGDIVGESPSDVVVKALANDALSLHRSPQKRPRTCVERRSVQRRLTQENGREARSIRVPWTVGGGRETKAIKKNKVVH